MGQFADEGIFVINEHTGEIYTTRSLDRDSTRGRQVWNFNVLAHDELENDGSSSGADVILADGSEGESEALTGYAEVRVIPRDINDNAPVFDRNRLVGHVPEHSRAGQLQLTFCFRSRIINVIMKVSSRCATTIQ